MIHAHDIRRAYDKFALFYDETNNIRKLTLTEDGTNVPERKNFVLGGVALEEGQALPDIASLRAALGMLCMTQLKADVSLLPLPA